MKLTDVLEFCDLVLAQYGNLDVVVFGEYENSDDFSLNEGILDLVEIPVSRFGDRTKLVMAVGVGRDIRYEEDQKIKQRKLHLKLVRSDGGKKK